MLGQMSVAKLLIQETGTYNPQYSRAYEVVATNDRMNALNTLENRIDQLTRNDPNPKINPSMLSGIASSLIVPSASFEKQLVIPNGWNEPRLRFLLELLVETSFGPAIYYFQGYTDYAGITANGTIDENMTFVINSFIRVNRVQQPGSPLGYTEQIVEAYQVINGVYYQNNNGALYTMRPEDVFTGIQSNYLKGSVSDYLVNEVYDARVDKSNESLRSRRVNAIPSNFMAKTIDNFRLASSLSDFGSGGDDIYSRAIQNSYEGTTFENPFLRALSGHKGIPNVTYFTMRDLLQIDNTAGQRTSYIRLSQTVRMHRVGDTDDLWSASTLETQIATMVTHSTSALMVESMLARACIHATNLTLTGESIVNIAEDFQSVTTSQMVPYLNNFIHRFKTEIMPDVTMNGQIGIDLRIRADLYGETHVEISINAKPHELYVTPSFCDTLMAPIVTTNHNSYHNLINGIEEVLNYGGGTTHGVIQQQLLPSPQSMDNYNQAFSQVMGTVGAVQPMGGGINSNV